MKVAKLNVKQKDILIGQEVESGVKFNPIQDSSNVWVISLEEVEKANSEWVKGLPLINYKPKKVFI